MSSATTITASVGRHPVGTLRIVGKTIDAFDLAGKRLGSYADRRAALLALIAASKGEVVE